MLSEKEMEGLLWLDHLDSAGAEMGRKRGAPRQKAVKLRRWRGLNQPVEMQLVLL